METPHPAHRQRRSRIALAMLVASAIACISQPIPIPTPTPPPPLPPGPIPTGAPEPPQQPAEPFLSVEPPAETPNLADTVPPPTEPARNPNEAILLGPPIRYLPLEMPEGHEPRFPQPEIDQGERQDGVSVCTVTFTADPLSLDMVRVVQYQAFLAPSISQADAVWREGAPAAPVTESGTISLRWEALVPCPHADECGQGLITSTTENTVMALNAMRVDNLVVIIGLQGRSNSTADTESLVQKLAFYLSLVTAKLPAE